MIPDEDVDVGADPAAAVVIAREGAEPAIAISLMALIDIVTTCCAELAAYALAALRAKSIRKKFKIFM